MVLGFKLGKLTKDEFIKKANLIHRNIYDYSLVDYENVGVKVKIICKEHEIFEQTPGSHLRGKGCPECGIRNRKFKIESLTREYIKMALNSNHLSEYDWSLDEIIFLKENYDKIPIKKICVSLNKTEVDVYLKINNLGIKKTKRWSVEELKKLIDVYEKSSTQDLISYFPNRSIGGIIKKADSLNLKRMNIECPKWTENEKEEVVDLFSKGFNDEQISNKLNRGINRVKQIRREKCKYVVWSIEEIKILKDNYSNKIIDELVLLLVDKTKDQIKTKSHKLKLKKDYDTYLRCFNIKDNVPNKLNKNGYWRTKIIKRDNFTCFWCDLKDDSGLSLNAHHIKPARDCSDGEKFDEKNGICLCLDCHKKTYNKEYFFMDIFKNNIIKKYYKHSGG